MVDWYLLGGYSRGAGMEMPPSVNSCSPSITEANVVIALALLNIADLAMTLWALRTGYFKEMNPIAKALYSFSPYALVAYKLFFTAVACWLMHACEQRIEKRWSLYIPHGIMVAIVSLNTFQIVLYLRGIR